LSDKFPVMLASPNKFIDRIKFPAYVQTKMDGMRANIVCKDNNTIVYSRNGKPMEMFQRFQHTIPNDHVVDGEFILFDNNGQLLDRKTGNGILHKAVVGTISEEEVSMIKMVVWDIIPVKEWSKGRYDLPYDHRLKRLKVGLNTDYFILIDTHTVKNMEEVEKIYAKKIKEGQEGLIIKNIDSPWEGKRSKHMIKMKEVLEIDLKIIDWIEGEGKYVGMLGKFICENKDHTISVGVGTGYSDEQRKNYTRDDVGKICSVKYNAVISSRTRDTKSLFLPVFVEFRPDKDEPE